jgi:hypothetical protein
MDKYKWNDFLDNLLEKHPDAFEVIDKARKDMNAKLEEMYKVDGYSPSKEYYPTAELKTDIHRSQRIKTLEKEFFGELKNKGIETPQKNPFDEVRQYYYKSEVEKGDKDLNDLTDRVDALKAKAEKLREMEKAGEPTRPQTFDELTANAEKQTDQKSTVTQQKDENKKDITEDKPNERSYGEPSKLSSRLEKYRDNGKTITKEKDKD